MLLEYVKNVQPEFMELFVKRAPQQVLTLFLLISVFITLAGFNSVGRLGVWEISYTLRLCLDQGFCEGKGNGNEKGI